MNWNVNFQKSMNECGFLKVNKFESGFLAVNEFEYGFSNANEFEQRVFKSQ